MIRITGQTELRKNKMEKFKIDKKKKSNIIRWLIYSGVKK